MQLFNSTLQNTQLSRNLGFSLWHLVCLRIRVVCLRIKVWCLHPTSLSWINWTVFMWVSYFDHLFLRRHSIASITQHWANISMPTYIWYLGKFQICITLVIVYSRMFIRLWRRNVFSRRSFLRNSMRRVKILSWRERRVAFNWWSVSGIPSMMTWRWWYWAPTKLNEVLIVSVHIEIRNRIIRFKRKELI